MFNMENIGRSISELRKAQNMTQMELADRMNISFQAVSNWERGNSMPDISKLPELAQLFGVTIDELLGEKSDLLKSAMNMRKRDYHRLLILRRLSLRPFYKTLLKRSLQTEGWNILNQLLRS